MTEETEKGNEPKRYEEAAHGRLGAIANALSCSSNCYGELLLGYELRIIYYIWFIYIYILNHCGHMLRTDSKEDKE